MSAWRETLDDLVRLRGRALFGYAYMLTGDASRAEDLLQDALVKAFRSGRHARSLDAAHVYVKRSIATSFIDSGRRAASRPIIAAGGGQFETWARQHPAAADHSTRVDNAIDLRSALLTLSPRERACVVLRYLEGMTTTEVADTLGIAAGSVKRYVSDGIGRLKVALPQMNFDGSEMVAVHTHERGRDE
ncbi:RNA polymerase sigma factor [Demequina aestuarii]|uniref:RNA polymerase sigma factor n=1 Tax=Demequina aestuarii TaxID=327095 RepID=UPI0007807E64|nr:RNA polymerase sigma factor [Demequina aestuarii]